MLEKSLVLSLKLSGYIEDFNNALTSAEENLAGMGFDKIKVARDEFATEVVRIDPMIPGVTDKKEAHQISNLLTTTRKDILPLYVRPLQRLAAVIESAQTNDREATLTAMYRISVING